MRHGFVIVAFAMLRSALTRSLEPLLLTLFGRSLLLFTSEILSNAICWIVAGILFGRNHSTQPILSLALLAWTLGLRHALDADHISRSVYVMVRTNRSIPLSAIDNATRGLINLGQLSVTCGLFFSLGHSTIVVVVTVAIAISSNAFDKLHNIGDIGGIIGAAVSGAFLFIIGLANTVILWRILKRRRKNKIHQQKVVNDENIVEQEKDLEHNHMIMMRILGPIITFVNRPWKMYPVGVLFGLGFDTASSIALLAISAIAKKGPDGKSIPSSHIVILPLLFTAGMTMVDSVDSILMLYSYTGFPEGSWNIFERSPRSVTGSSTEGQLPEEGLETPALRPHEPTEMTAEPSQDKKDIIESPREIPRPASPVSLHLTSVDNKVARDTKVKMNMMSGLSIVLTLMSIIVAFSISLITIMGLIGDQCAQCRAAAEAEDGGGLAGSWWRGWAHANDNSGYIGAAIVGSFVVIVIVWYGYRKGVHKARNKKCGMSNELPPHI